MCYMGTTASTVYIVTMTMKLTNVVLANALGGFSDLATKLQLCSAAHLH